MIVKGIVTNKNKPDDIRIVIPSHENNVSFSLELAKHINFEDINIGDQVIAAFYSKTDGVIITQCQR